MTRRLQWVVPAVIFALSVRVPASAMAASGRGIFPVEARPAISGAIQANQPRGLARRSVAAFQSADSENAQSFQEEKLTASGGADGDFLGSSVAISGDTLVVGAPNATIGSRPY